jgi:hypothetical protein
MTRTPCAIDQNHDICYSPDDDAKSGKGWYVQRFPDHATSQLFATAVEAIQALAEGNCIWEEEDAQD